MTDPTAALDIGHLPRRPDGLRNICSFGRITVYLTSMEL